MTAAASPDTFLVHEGSSVEVAGVSKSFRRKGESLSVLQGISLEAAGGEFISVIGPSGCGKSTMFNILAGLEVPDSGDVRVNGAVVTGQTEHFAYMPQKDLLFPWRRVIDNAGLGLEIQGMKRSQARARVEPLLETFGLTEFASCYPFELSGGMRQRVALLRTVVQGRPVVLLDEPFGALDYLTRTDLQLWLSSMWEQFHWTVILVTHDVPEAVLMSDRVYVLGARPATVKRVVEVDLGRPRGLDCLGTAHFAELEEVLLQELRTPERPADGLEIRR
ncbi:MAG: ABC transporter ATP-binding protein [Acidimicrobiales bacterium]